MQRPYATSLDTKHGEAKKTKSCRYLSVCQVYNASLATKVSKVHHQVESLEALKRAEKGGDNTPVGHHGPRIQQKWGHRLQCEQQHAKTRVLYEAVGRVTT